MFNERNFIIFCEYLVAFSCSVLMMRFLIVETKVERSAIAQKVAPILLNFLASLFKSLMVERIAILSNSLRHNRNKYHSYEYMTKRLV